MVAMAAPRYGRPPGLEAPGVINGVWAERPLGVAGRTVSADRPPVPDAPPGERPLLFAPPLCPAAFREAGQPGLHSPPTSPPPPCLPAGAGLCDVASGSHWTTMANKRGERHLIRG
ncbi:hypothetical protein MRX96_034443 [Rhipicephalus microplus]